MTLANPSHPHGSLPTATHEQIGVEHTKAVAAANGFRITAPGSTTSPPNVAQYYRQVTLVTFPPTTSTL